MKVPTPTCVATSVIVGLGCDCFQRKKRLRTSAGISWIVSFV